MNEPIPEILTRRTSGKLSSEELEKRILKFLDSRRMCVLSTCRDNVPRATPILYRSKGFTLYMVGEPGRKISNIRHNPDVSVGIFDPEGEFSMDWEHITGMQITGHARLIGKGEAGFTEAFRMFGRPEAWAEHWHGMMIEVVPERIELLCMALKLDDCAARQVWRAPLSGERS